MITDETCCGWALDSLRDGSSAAGAMQKRCEIAGAGHRCVADALEAGSKLIIEHKRPGPQGYAHRQVNRLIS